jgi:hypothetical protein
MTIYYEKISPPIAPFTQGEPTKMQLEAVKSEDVWVEDFVSRLAGVIRDLKH